MESWINVCTEPKTVDRIKLARVRIATMLRNESPLERVIAPILAGPEQMYLWRANWQEKHMDALAECYAGRTMTDLRWRAAQRAVREITEELISASLDLHGLRKEKGNTWGGRHYDDRLPKSVRKDIDAARRKEMETSHVVFPLVGP